MIIWKVKLIYILVFGTFLFELPKILVTFNGIPSVHISVQQINSAVEINWISYMRKWLTFCLKKLFGPKVSEMSLISFSAKGIFIYIYLGKISVHSMVCVTGQESNFILNFYGKDINLFIDMDWYILTFIT